MDILAKKKRKKNVILTELIETINNKALIKMLILPEAISIFKFIIKAIFD
jgi:hypothetical protein